MAAVARRAMQQQGAQHQQQLLQLALATARSAAVCADWTITDVTLSSTIPGAVPSSTEVASQNRQSLLGGRQKQQPSEVLCTLAPSKPWNYRAMRGYYMRNVSQLVAPASGKKAFLVDTLALVRRLEAQGLTPKQAEAITAVITEVLNDSLENVAQSFTSKTEMQRSEMMAEAALSKFKGEMQSSQEHHFATLQRETERLRTDIDKMRSELRYEIDKVTAGQRLDLNLERGRIREELATQSAETSNLTNKLDREIHTLKTQLEAAKYDVIKYCIGTIVSVTAVGLGLLRILITGGGAAHIGPFHGSIQASSSPN